ncbi:hypothetical protein Aros01_01894 [Streptosporangium roseum]
MHLGQSATHQVIRLVSAGEPGLFLDWAVASACVLAPALKADNRSRWLSTGQISAHRLSAVDREQLQHRVGLVTVAVTESPMRGKAPHTPVRHSFDKTGRTARTPGIGPMAGEIARARAGSENLMKKEPG